MLTWLSGLFAASAPVQVATIEEKAPSFEEQLDRIITHSRGFKNKTDENLKLFIDDIDAALGVLEQAIDIIDRADLESRAIRVRTRLRKARTRALNQRDAA